MSIPLFVIEKGVIAKQVTLNNCCAASFFLWCEICCCDWFRQASLIAKRIECVPFRHVRALILFALCLSLYHLFQRTMLQKSIVLAIVVHEYGIASSPCLRFSLASGKHILVLRFSHELRFISSLSDANPEFRDLATAVTRSEVGALRST